MLWPQSILSAATTSVAEALSFCLVICYVYIPCWQVFSIFSFLFALLPSAGLLPSRHLQEEMGAKLRWGLGIVVNADMYVHPVLENGFPLLPLMHIT